MEPFLMKKGPLHETVVDEESFSETAPFSIFQ
jgi:hypothetical protein